MRLLWINGNFTLIYGALSITLSVRMKRFPWPCRRHVINLVIAAIRNSCRPSNMVPLTSFAKSVSFGHIKYEGREYHVGSAFYGLHVALRQTTTDGLFDVYFCQHKIGVPDLMDNKLS